MAHTAREIATYLAAQGYGTLRGSWTSTSTGSAISYGPMAADPDKAIAVRVSGGPAPLYTNDAPTPWNERSRVQIMVRDGPATGYDPAETTANQIARALELSHVKIPTATGTLYQWMRPAAPVVPLRFDEQERPIFVVNIEIDKEPST